MSRVFVISDLHDGHENMAIKRGFINAGHQRGYLKACWNNVVTKRDKVIVLGDITMEKNNYSFLDDLNGIKTVILGNHDKEQHVRDMLNYVNNVCGMMTYKGLVLTHCPIHPSELTRFKANVHGHVHENSLDDTRYINVSCEVVGYTPVLITKFL